MTIAYIAHPISGDVKGNLVRISKIVREININEPEVVPFVPYYADCTATNEDDPKERARGIKNDEALFRKGFIDELRLYGDRISDGMWAEIDLAEELGIGIRPMTDKTTEELKLDTEGDRYGY